MSIESTLTSKLEALLADARFAPSVHNTQPWVVSVRDDSLSIAIDPRHHLHDGDPTGRQTIISLGIFAEALVIAAHKQGLTATGVDLQGEACCLTFQASEQAADGKEVALLHSRCSDRSVYKPVDVPDATFGAIKTARQHPGVDIITSRDSQHIASLAQLTSQGIQLALSNPAFRAELSHYLVRPGSRAHRGIATQSLYIPRLVQPFEPWLVRTGLANQVEVKLEKRRWESASGLVFICARGDLHKDWFEVGRTYLRVSLAIEQAGLSQATSAAIVEASDFHEDIEKMLGTTMRIQAIIRIGQGKSKRYHSPRLTPAELLSTSS